MASSERASSFPVLWEPCYLSPLSPCPLLPSPLSIPQQTSSARLSGGGCCPWGWPGRGLTIAGPLLTAVTPPSKSPQGDPQGFISCRPKGQASSRQNNFLKAPHLLANPTHLPGNFLLQPRSASSVACAERDEGHSLHFPEGKEAPWTSAELSGPSGGLAQGRRTLTLSAPGV